MAGVKEGGWLPTIGIILFVGTSGIPAAGKHGFMFDYGLDVLPQMALSAVGGALGGWLMCRHWAGLVGGAIAGPCGYWAVYYWAQNRERLYKLELALAQLMGSAPGFGVYWLLMKLTDRPTDPTAPPPDPDRNTALDP